ncbi:MAG: peptidoglycan-binding protein, partial [Methylophilaceae bacterium]
MNKIIFPPALKLDTVAMPATGKPVGELQTVLSKLNLDVHPSDIARKQMGASTLEAVKTFQASAGLPADGNLTPDTVTKLNDTLAHNFVANSKSRTQRLQDWLEKTGQKVDPAELKSRKFGASTEQALKAFQAKAGLAQDGRISEQLLNQLQEEALKTKLSSKTQIAQLQSTLLRALDIAKLNKDVRVDATELKSRQIGPSTQAAIKAVQTKYKLPVTGQLDAATFERLTSIAASIRQPVRQLKAQNAATLKPLKRAARLNMKSAHVTDVQSTMAFLGYKIDESEFKAKVFGKTTRDAVVNYQKSRGLAVTGHAADDTLRSLNLEIQRANPAVEVGKFPYRVRGSVRDKLWVGMAGVNVQIWEKLVAGQGAMLAERKTGANGFFDITYPPPLDVANKQIKQSFNLEIKVPSIGNMSKLLANPTQIAWTNFTQGNQPYRGVSEFQTLMEAVSKLISPTKVVDLVEKPAQRQISQAAQTAGLTVEDVMQLVLAHLVSARLSHPPLGPEVCYAYIAQALPSSLPGDLIDSTEDWALITNLIDLATNGLVFMDDNLLGLAFDNAVTMNLMPISIGLQKGAVIAALAQLKQVYVLEKPILVGNGSLKGLLDTSSIDKAHYADIAIAFLKHKSFGPDFWADLNTHPADFGGVAALNDLRTTVEIGHITKNFEPMLILLKQKIADPNTTIIKSARDLAKLTQDDWVGLINANSGRVPANTDHTLPADKVQTYAATLMSQSEKLFPAVALVATVARSANNPLSKVKGIQDLLDDNPDFNLGSDNLDIYVKKNNIPIDEDTLDQARVMQRVHRIAPTALAGQVLLDNKIHNSSQILGMGKDQFISAMTKNNLIDKRVAATVYGKAEFQYAQVLQRITEYRADMHRADPVAIVDHNYSKAELPPELVAIPDLELLFGSLDFCSCSHCQSVYGPAAYLADVLRFLGKHPAEAPGKTVQDILFERRPDIGNIKLNCENTDTPMPYIDLVCEILENAVPAPTPAPQFSFQTTREAAELRAVPEHVRESTYDKLRIADFPLNLGFDLWQEQSRVFMQHLGVARWQLMEAFQAKPQGGPFAPIDTCIAGEYWNMSSFETTLIIASVDNTATKQKTYWGVSSGALPTALSVADFMRRTLLSYSELFDLLCVQWINPLGNANNVVIERPDGTCDTELQQVTNLTANKLDQMHRFLRLWRHTGWAMWEVDLLIRAGLDGDSALDDNCLIHLKQFEQLQKRLGFSVEQVLILFGNINAETRAKLDNPHQPYQSLYQTLFLNPAIINPIDPVFSLPIAGGLKISDHKSTVLATYGLSEDDFSLLKTKLANDDLTVSNLSKIARYAVLAQGLKLCVKDLLTLEALSGIANIFATPKVTLDFIESVDWAANSAFSLDELDYLLNLLPDSPVG